MTHYSVKPPQQKEKVIHRQRWETFAAFLAFTSLVALAGATYGALRRGDVYTEVHAKDELSRFAGVLESSSKLSDELRDKSRTFTIIAPSDAAFVESEVRFVSDEEQSDINDKRIVQMRDSETNYILQGEGFVVRSYVLPHEMPENEALNLPAANGDIIVLQRQEKAGKNVVSANNVRVRDRIVADNGIIYIVDQLIHPLPEDDARQASR